jgi:hypothetical protein
MDIGIGLPNPVPCRAHRDPFRRLGPPRRGVRFGWEIDDVGFGAMIRRPVYGDHLVATVDPGIHERQAEVQAPPGFADAIGWLAPAATDEQPHWHVTFTVADRDQSLATISRLGGTVLESEDTEWTRRARVRDPQGAVFG